MKDLKPNAILGYQIASCQIVGLDGNQIGSIEQNVICLPSVSKIVDEFRQVVYKRD